MLTINLSEAANLKPGGNFSSFHTSHLHTHPALPDPTITTINFSLTCLQVRHPSLSHPSPSRAATAFTQRGQSAARLQGTGCTRGSQPGTRAEYARELHCGPGTSHLSSLEESSARRILPLLPLHMASPSETVSRNRGGRK